MIDSARLLYESLTRDHAAGLFPRLSDERVYRYLPGEAPRDLEELEREFAVREAGLPESELDEQWINFAAFLHDTGCVIGRVEATRVGAWAEVAYLFGVEFWGHGFAAEAMRSLHRYLSDATPTEVCWAAVLPGNSRSRRLLQRLGYAEVADGWPAMRSYDPGDVVYRLRLTPLGDPPPR